MAQLRFYFQNKRSIIKDLPDPKIELTIILYRNKESFEHIRKQVDLKSHVKQINLYKHLPYERSTKKCHCGDMLYYKTPPNSIKKSKQRFQCLACGHNDAPWCTCNECVRKRNLRREEGMKEFMTCMITYLFPEGKDYEDPFEESKENTSKFI